MSPIHMGDAFSLTNAGYDKTWPPPPQTPIPSHTPRSKERSVTDWDQASRDSTNQDLLDHGLVQPGDL